MDLHTISFLFGAVLAAVAILGGGFEVKEIKVPKVGRVARFFAGVLGAVFLVIGISEFFPVNIRIKDFFPAKTTEPAQSEAIEEKGVAFTVSTWLGKLGGKEERETDFEIVIDGTKTAVLHLDREQPSQSVSVAVPNAGQHKYVISGRSLNVLTVENEKRIPLHGSGVIDVNPGASFSIEAKSPLTTTMESWSVNLTLDTEGNNGGAHSDEENHTAKTDNGFWCIVTLGYGC